MKKANRAVGLFHGAIIITPEACNAHAQTGISDR